MSAPFSVRSSLVVFSLPLLFIQSAVAAPELLRAECIKMSGETLIGLSCSDYPLEITIPSMVNGTPIRAIGNAAFYELQLKDVQIPDSVTSIGKAAFAYNALTSIRIPAGVISISMWAFAFNQITSAQIPDGVMTIGQDAFRMNQLTSIRIPNSVASISDGAFRKNPLTSVLLPAMTTIESHSFDENVAITRRAQ